MVGEVGDGEGVTQMSILYPDMNGLLSDVDNKTDGVHKVGGWESKMPGRTGSKCWKANCGLIEEYEQTNCTNVSWQHIKL